MCKKRGVGKVYVFGWVGGGGGQINLTMVIMAVNLRASKVRKMGKIGLTYVFNFFVCL